MWVYNAQGYSYNEKNEKKQRKEWSFTTDVTVFTLGRIDPKRLGYLADYAEKTTNRIISVSGLNNPTFDTVGAEVDREFEFSDTIGLGSYYARVAVEDVDLATCDFRYRPDISALIDDSVNEMESEGLLDYESIKDKARVSRLLKSLSRGIRELIKLGREAGKFRRRSSAGKT